MIKTALGTLRFVVLLLAGCAGTPLPEEPRSPLGLDQQGELSFSVSQIGVLDRNVETTMTWQPARAGFSPKPDAGRTEIQAALVYEGGKIAEVGEPARQVEAELVLHLKTLDGTLDEVVPCLLRAPNVDFWICQGDLEALTGAFTVVDHPPGALVYTAWMRRDGDQVSGGVGAVVAATTELGEGQSTGVATGFQAGLWHE